MGSNPLWPTRVLELESYHAIAECVAAGTGGNHAAVRSQGCTRGKLGQRAYLAPKLARVRTNLVWRNGHKSCVLQSVWGELARHPECLLAGFSPVEGSAMGRSLPFIA